MTQTLNFTKLSKSGKYAIYAGLRTKIRVATTVFPDQKPAPSFTVDGDFAGPRVAMTPEERKAARKNAPKPTLAELIAKREKALLKLKAKAAVAGNEPAPQAEAAVGSF